MTRNEKALKMVIIMMTINNLKASKNPCPAVGHLRNQGWGFPPPQGKIQKLYKVYFLKGFNKISERIIIMGSKD